MQQLVKIVVVLHTLGVVMMLVSVGMAAVCRYKSNQKVCGVRAGHRSTISKQAIRISISVNGMVFLLYAIAMDAAAVHYRDKGMLSKLDLEAIDSEGKLGHLVDVLYKLPIVALIFDIVGFMISIGIFLIFIALYLCDKDLKDKRQEMVVSASPLMLGPVFALVTHSPYIAIAYINDAYYAGSIFVYYMVTFFACFAAVHLTMNACLRSIVIGEQNIWYCIFLKCCKPKAIVEEENAGLDQNDAKMHHIHVCQALCPIAATFLMLLCILSTVIIAVCYLVIIPLNGSVSGAPHQLFGFYQSIIIFLGILITYKTLLHKKRNGIKYAIKKKADLDLSKKLKASTWDDLPDEEKNLKFYSMVVELVDRFYRNQSLAITNAECAPTDIQDADNPDAADAGPGTDDPAAADPGIGDPDAADPGTGDSGTGALSDGPGAGTDDPGTDDSDADDPGAGSNETTALLVLKKGETSTATGETSTPV